MRTITEIQSCLSKILSSNEMALVKGGTTIAPDQINNAIQTVTTFLASPEVTTATASINKALLDDKRRERPGGGISTL